jgi:hypothetical protein
MTPEQQAIKTAAIRGGAIILAEARAARDALSPRQAAEAAYRPGHRLGSIDAIEALIIQQRREAELSAQAHQPLAA